MVSAHESESWAWLGKSCSRIPSCAACEGCWKMEASQEREGGKRALCARWVETRDEEQAVSVLTQGPVRPKV